MPTPQAPPKIPTIVTTKFNENDRTAMAELMQLSGLTEGAQVVRLALRLAADHLRAAKGIRLPKHHTPIEPR